MFIHLLQFSHKCTFKCKMFNTVKLCESEGVIEGINAILYARGWCS